MTQHPFDHKFSEQEAAKLNAEQEPTDSEQELTDQDINQIAGGSTDYRLTTLPFEKPKGEAGGGTSDIRIEAG